MFGEGQSLVAAVIAAAVRCAKQAQGPGAALATCQPHLRLAHPARPTHPSYPALQAP